MMNEKVYKVLVWVFRVFIPALTALYATVAAIVGLPYGEQVTAIGAALTVFGNAVLMYDSNKFFEDKDIVDKVEE